MMDPSIPKPTDLEKIGSRGGGPSLSAYGKTIIKTCETSTEVFSHLKDNTNQQFSISINGVDQTKNAKTSISVLEFMQPLLPQQFTLEITHNFDLPIGCGYGSSSSGSLGLALALDHLFNLNLSYLEAAKYAHYSDVSNHTGLGTIGGQFTGGLSISLEPGYPFKFRKIPFPDNIKIIVGSWGPIPTKDILTNMEYRQLIHEKGMKAMQSIKDDFTLGNYVKVCKDFINETHLLDKLHLDPIQKLINELNMVAEYGASMNQLGNSVFCICTQQEEQNLLEVFKKYNPTHVLKVLNICEETIMVK